MSVRSSDVFDGEPDGHFDELLPGRLRGGITGADAMEDVRHYTFAVMVTVLAFTQLAFLTLGVATMLRMARSSGHSTHPPFADFILHNWLWFYVIALCWIAYGTFSQRVNRSPFLLSVARPIGVALAVAYFLFFGAATFVSY
ncbi:MAG TPA: hypothetical protein DCE44_21405 [Verrucomicrobiales bacterium]|nr:hypothetical protein [Verrucomicrobiales bacterium]